MAQVNQSRTENWTAQQALLLLAACLLAGVAGGWLLRQWKNPASVLPQRIAASAAPAASTAAQAAAGPAQLKAVVDANAAPLLTKLQSDPNNADVLTSLGNLYYDAQQYAAAIDYYGRALKARPTDVSVRTDMGTAFWYMGNADSAIAAFDQALTYEPNNPNTLFNRGLVRWQGKNDNPGALADWNQLLAKNPSYSGREQVEQMIAHVQQHAGAAPAATQK
jgi:tetratricopeptide (TPR) repeat protein